MLINLFVVAIAALIAVGIAVAVHSSTDVDQLENGERN